MTNRLSRLGLTIMAILFTASVEARADGGFLVANFNGNNIQSYETSGNFTGTFASGNGLSEPDQFVYGRDGSLYVSSFGTNSILHYSASGSFLGTFASGLGGPAGLAFGADGNLYVVDNTTSQITRLNGTTGANLGSFSGGGDLLPRWNDSRPRRQHLRFKRNERSASI